MKIGMLRSVDRYHRNALQCLRLTEHHAKEAYDYKADDMVDFIENTLVELDHMEMMIRNARKNLRILKEINDET